MPDDAPPPVLPGEPPPAYSPTLRKVIEDPNGAFQKWKRGEISYLQMCGDFTKELTLARMEAAAQEQSEEATRTIG